MKATARHAAAAVAALALVGLVGCSDDDSGSSSGSTTTNAPESSAPSGTKDDSEPTGEFTQEVTGSFSSQTEFTGDVTDSVLGEGTAEGTQDIAARTQAIDVTFPDGVLHCTTSYTATPDDDFDESGNISVAGTGQCEGQSGRLEGVSSTITLSGTVHSNEGEFGTYEATLTGTYAST